MTQRTPSELKFDPEDLIIRPANRSDLPALEWHGVYLKYRRMFASIYRDSRQGRVLMWIVEHKNGELIGQAFVLLNSSEPDSANGQTHAYVFAFRIKPEWRSLGIGSYLMQFIEADLRTRGFTFVTLNVARDNVGALRLYQRLGYRVTGPRPGVWSFVDHRGRTVHVNEPAWHMQKDLRESD